MIWRLALGLLVAGAIVVIGLQIRENSGREVPAPLVLVAPDRTPLPRDSGPENNSSKEGAAGRRSPRTRCKSVRAAGCSTATRAQTPRSSSTSQRQSPTRRSPARKPPKAHSPPRRPDASQNGGNSPQPGNQPPPQEPKPVVTVPSPKVCVNGLVEVGDCG